MRKRGIILSFVVIVVIGTLSQNSKQGGILNIQQNFTNQFKTTETIETITLQTLSPINNNASYNNDTSLLIYAPPSRQLEWIDTYPINLPFPTTTTGNNNVPTMLNSSIVIRPSHASLFAGGGANNQPVLLGLILSENPAQFISMGKRGTMHMFHAVEFYVCIFAELHRRQSQQHPSSPLPKVQWLLSHYFPTLQFQGLNDVNVQIAHAIFGPHVKFYGYEYVDNLIHVWQQSWFANHGEPWVKRPILKAGQQNYTHLQQNYRRLEAQGKNEILSAVRAILLCDRGSTPHGTIHKMWANYIHDFNYQQWHDNIIHHGNFTSNNNNNTKLIVTYIDRQSTGRKLPQEDHEWILSTFSNHSELDFQLVRMEQMTARAQMELAVKTNVLMGVHGNGMTHQLWMPPRGHVVEFFCRASFQYDYGSAAMLLRHNYTAIFNGRRIDPAVIDAKDLDAVQKQAGRLRVRRPQFRTETKLYLIQMIQEAIADRKQRYDNNNNR